MDFEEIIEFCGINKEPASVIQKKIESLSERYSQNELTEIYKFLLTNIQDPQLLEFVVKLTNEHQSTQILPILVDTLLLKNSNYDNMDEYINLRVTCAKAISKYKDNSTVGALLYCLNNKNENYKIRLACADALGRIGDRFAVTPLINVVKDEEEKSVYVKESAAFALGLIGDTSAIDPLVAIMEAKQGIWDKFSFLKERIIEALGKLSLNNTKILKVYKSSLLDSSPMVRINTIEALMNSEFDEASELIRTALNDTDEEVQKNALVALYNIIGRDILDEVISLPGYSKFLKEEAQNLINEYEEEEDE